MRALPLLFLAAIFVVVCQQPCDANVFGDLWGVVTDPLKLGKASTELSDSAQRSLIQISELESQTNYDAQQRLEQMRSILKDAITSGETVIDEVTNKMHDLEDKINQDAINLIYRAQCATQTVMMVQMQQSFAQFIKNVRDADPGIRILGITLVRFHVNEIRVANPDDAYITAKAAVLAKLDKDVKDNTSAYNILSTYENLSRQAGYTRCYYIDQVSEIKWIRGKE